MARNYVQAGMTLTYANASGVAILSGAVVIAGAMVCVASNDIADGESGELLTEGVFEVAKLSGAVVAQGDAAIWDVSGKKVIIAAAAAGDVLGSLIVWEAAGSGDTVVRVKLAGLGSVQA